MSCDGDFLGHALWLQQCLVLLLDRLHPEYVLPSFCVAAIQILLRTYVLCEVLCLAGSCTYCVLEFNVPTLVITLLHVNSRQYLDQIRHMRMSTARTAVINQSHFILLNC